VVSFKYEWSYHSLGRKVTVVKRKVLLILAVIGLLTLTFAIPVKAATKIDIFGYVGEIQYMPGDEGTLKLWVYNNGDEDVILKTVTIEYPWHNYYIWEGNETIRDINALILKGGNWSTTKSFTVPKDGRVTGGNIQVEVVTDKVSRTEWVYLDVANPSEYFSLQSMERIVTLLTIMAVLIIVCTIIIAATIFLSTRRPQVTWKKEEKAAE